MVVPAASYFVFSQAFPGREPSFPLVCLVSLIASALSGFVLGRYANPLWVLFLALVGICVGVIVNADYDFRFHGYEHNLFPIEIAFFAILVMPGMLCGVILNHLTYQDTTVFVTIYDDSGNQIGLDSFTLLRGQHMAFTLTQRYPQTLNRRGTLRIETSAISIRCWGCVLIRMGPSQAHRPHRGSNIPLVTEASNVGAATDKPVQSTRGASGSVMRCPGPSPSIKQIRHRHPASAVRAKPFHTWCGLKGQQNQWRAKRNQEPNVRPMFSH